MAEEKNILHLPLQDAALCVWLCAAFLVGCGTFFSAEREARPLGPVELATAPEGNFTLYVCNTSFAVDPVDIKVYIDGKLALYEDFYVGNQHSWKEFVFQLTPGKHTLKAESKKGKAQFATEFESGPRNWAVVDYWYRPKVTRFGGPTPRSFTFHIEDIPIGFL